MLCAAVLQFTLRQTATGIARPIFAQTKTKKLASTGIFAFSCKLFAVVTVKTNGSRSRLLEELCHTDLIDQPAFLLCLVDHIARLAVPDQKGRGGIVHTHILRYSHTAGVGVAV